ncbi:uncharacterized protein LOC141902204 [Tubulanus polymorphus]|uniref:uncharacterized protein LOC141902204 n=1 Tax=Tubulanus polymorphus TaxID=672921 RepID=UPI003DA4B73A
MIRMARCLWSGTVCFLVATCMFLSLQYTRNEFNPTEAQQVWMRQRSNVHRKVAVDTREQADGGANNRRRQILVNGLPIDRVVLPRNSSSILATLQWKLRQDRAKKMSEYGCHVPFLETITFEPDIRLNPVFDPQKTDYSSNVPYSIHLIKIDVTATGCFMAARIDDKYGVSRWVSYP